MSGKIKVYNNNDFNVGLKLMDGIRKPSVPKNGFIMLDEDDIYHIDSISTVFKRKMLTVKEPEINKNLGFNEGTSIVLSDSDIETILKGTLPKIKKDFEKITEPHMKSKVFEIARKMYADLNGSKIDYIAEFCGRDSEDLKPIKDEIESKVTK